MGSLAVVTLLAAAAADYRTSIETWRHQYEEGLRAPQGWLSVAGLFWLHQGSNRIGFDPQNDIVLPAPAPKFAGIFDFHDGAVYLKPAPGVPFLIDGKAPVNRPLQPDITGHPDVVTLGNLSLTVIRRGDRTGLRLRDPESAARRNFTGLHWFPIDQHFAVRARWHPYSPPHKLPIVNVLGMTEQEDCPGYAEFELAGRTWRLEPTVEDNTLFFMFRDQTSATETYPSGRFLYTGMPHNGEILIDFNQAHNPPCAFTSFATCPLPPKQNTLGLRIEAGEKRYAKH